jgi:hypothetical protein
MSSIIKGLTLHRPWGWAIRTLNKRVENRGYKCSLPLNSYVAIHNGKKWDKDGAAFLDQVNPSGLFENPVDDPNDQGLITCVARYRGTVEESDSEWFFGPYGWILDDVVPIDNIKIARGQQGLWNLDDEILSQVRIEYQKNKLQKFA